MRGNAGARTVEPQQIFRGADPCGERVALDPGIEFRLAVVEFRGGALARLRKAPPSGFKRAGRAQLRQLRIAAAMPGGERLDPALELLARQPLGAHLGIAQDPARRLAEGALDLGGVGLAGRVDERPGHLASLALQPVDESARCRHGSPLLSFSIRPLEANPVDFGLSSALSPALSINFC